MMARPAGPRRQLTMLVVLFMVALLRVEHGLAELKGRTDTPSRILHLAPAPAGCWDAALFGFGGRLCPAWLHSPAPERLERAQRALPAWVGSSVGRLLEVLVRPRRQSPGSGFLVFHDQQVDGHIQHLRLDAGQRRLLHQVHVSADGLRWH